MTQQKLSNVAKTTLSTVQKTGNLTGKLKMVQMLKRRGYVERAGIDGHFIRYRLTAAGHEALGLSDNEILQDSWNDSQPRSMAIF